MQLGQFLAAAFVFDIAFLFLLAVLADLEQLRFFRRLTRGLRGEPGSFFDNFFRRNSFVNRVLSIIAAGLLIARPVVDSTIAQVNHFMAWSETQGLPWRIFALFVIAYLFLGIAVQIERFLRHELRALMSTAALMPSEEPDLTPDEEALLEYRHAIRKPHWLD